MSPVIMRDMMHGHFAEQSSFCARIDTSSRRASSDDGLSSRNLLAHSCDRSEKISVRFVASLTPTPSDTAKMVSMTQIKAQFVLEQHFFLREWRQMTESVFIRRNMK